MAAVRCTMAQALVRYLCNQFIRDDDKEVPLFPGVFAIFGHGNVTCLAEALEAVKETLPTWRGRLPPSRTAGAVACCSALATTAACSATCTG